jgi:O-antigen ligase
MTSLELSCAAAALLLVLNLFLGFERRGRGDLTVQTVLGAIVVDSVLNPIGFATPTGLFKLPVGPYSLFLPEIVITLALIARLAGRRKAVGWSADRLWWAAFFLWVLGAALRGVLAGHPTNLVLFEAKVLLYVGGSLALASAGRLHGEGLWRLIRWVAPLAGLLIVLDQAGVRVTAELPLVPLRGFGQMGADAATILGSLGLVGLLLAGPHGRPAVDAGAALVLTAAPLVSHQRAALIAWAISIAVAVILTAVRRWRWARPAHPSTASLLALAVGAALVLPVSARLVTEPATAVPLIGQLQQSFGSPAKRQSWQSRQYQWAVAPTLVAEHPWIGSGLGTTYWHFEVAQDRLIETDVTHNLALDLLVRAGVFGVCLFLLALWCSLGNGLATIWRSPDEAAAALGIAFVSVVAGLLAKGMVESILEKYRIAVLLGLSLGALGSAAGRMGSSRPAASQPSLVRSNGG